ncbi:rhodanese-like domain-containing protein [Nitrosomonas marina]|uniref:Rhodanese-related sulfurtransferase n=1 Tax=Nitrosomonas marina TaxID=917 RepID=A0A1H8D8G3_9PROT|nr:rhodanese-like domain-containing protein [Nitrosomonas marina]SEN03124.1 Rhodanese-related sulfurtransferase [Nitrosomonas marina]
MRTIRYITSVFLLGLTGLAIACAVSSSVFLKTAYALVAVQFGDIPTISNKSLYPLLDKTNSELVLVDVRTPEERRISVIPGAITKDDFEDKPAKYQNRTIVVYCTIGYRSGQYTRQLRQQGLDAYNLSEGILGWTHIDGQLVNDQQQTTRQVHVYSRPWNLAVKNHTVIF